MIDEVVRHGDLGSFTQPAPERMFPPLEPLRIWGAIIFEKEARRGGEFEKVFVERGRNRLFVSEYGGCRAPDRGHVPVGKLDKLHQLANETLHVGSWMIAHIGKADGWNPVT